MRRDVIYDDARGGGEERHSHVDDSYLTRRQGDVLAWLREHRRRGGRPPVLDEICRGLRLHSRGSLHKHVHALVEAGFVEPIRGKKRGVRLRGEANGAEVPLVGAIAAGRPIEAVEVPEWVEAPAPLRGDRPCFALRVRGESMIEDGILDGDVVIVERREQARDGEIVVALIDGAEATLKRLHTVAGPPPAVELRPANAHMEALRYAPERVRVTGVVTGQMRSYRRPG